MKVLAGLLACVLALGIVPVRAEGDPPGHACWDLGNEEAADCYGAHARWVATNADEALVRFLGHLRSDRREGSGRDEPDLVAVAIDVHRLAHLDAEATCAIQASLEPRARRRWVLDACRLHVMVDRAEQLAGDLDAASDEMQVALGSTWPPASGELRGGARRRPACPSGTVEAAIACAAERAAQAEAQLAELYAALKGDEAARAFAAYAEAECGLLRALTRAPSRQARAYTYAPCKAAAAEGRLASLVPLLDQKAMRP